MKLLPTLSALLCATGALAATEWADVRPGWNGKIQERADDKVKEHGSSHRPIPAPRPKGSPSRSRFGPKNDAYTYNWSGAVKYASAGELVTSVAATFTMPTPSVPTNKPAGSYVGSAWVGLGGGGTNDSIWQAGAIWYVDNSKNPTSYTYNVWYEWLPLGSVNVPNFPTGPGHIITVNLNADRPGTGAVIISDRTSGQTTSITTQAPNPTATLKGGQAEWVTEDPTCCGGLMPYANYGKVRYTGAKWGNFAGGSGNLANTNISIVQGVSQSSGKVNSQATLISSTEVDTQFVPANA